jgi:hypothetical protein
MRINHVFQQESPKWSSHSAFLAGTNGAEAYTTLATSCRSSWRNMRPVMNRLN